ncbi:beta-lactamase [Mycobacterium lentiflavum]|uniref:Beta-lactamase n=1 Tax=Mycobacterium lentiflavum TaxID=141349 RepID=A0A0E4CMZ1_MYCLN|nr:serine hydrolase domain-containing protein [Mycobacterium lentiflavum]MEE3063244.1 serine hydrolase domain-containing protein [Actinomycetota bacterium]ULP44402.1 beta-lactamase family protein [Mycobacterium lentiflavum]CQD12557.1 beta-lactamase [Mycobacterium lentiflavum]
MNLDGNQASIREACDAGLLAGAVTLVWQHGEVLQVNEIGYRDVGAGLPMQRDTLFRIASMTKPVVVAAIMSMVDEGKLTLKDPITHWVPELADLRVLDDRHGPLDRTHPVNRAILIEDLLTHTSGLAYGFSVSGPISRAYLRLPFNQGPDAWVSELAKLPLVHQPGERMTYSHSIDLLGVIAARIEGKPFDQVLDERVLGPIGMPDTGFCVSPEGRRRAATMYRLDGQSRLHHDVMGPPHITPPSFPNAGGGLLSTADDYLRFVRMLLGDGTIDGVRVLSPESVRLMRTDRLTDEHKRHDFLGAPYWVGRGFGLNLSVVTDPAKSAPLFGPGGLGTFSWPGAYGTWWQADPAADLVLLYLVQNMPDMSADVAAAVAGNTTLAKLQAVQPKFVRRTYQALDL